MSMRENNPNYRVRFLSGLLPTFVPPLAVPFILKWTGISPFLNSARWYTIVILEITTFIMWNVVRVQWVDYRNRKEAKRLGARMVPYYRGRWPGNVDFIWDLIQAQKIEYSGMFFEKILKDHGTTTLNLRIFWTDGFLTSDEGVVKYMLATGFEHFDKGWRFKEVAEDMLGNGIFNRDGETWKSHRALARPFFARERIADFATFEKNTNKALALIDAQDGNAFDAQDLYTRFTLDVAGEFLFDTSLDTLSLPLPKAGLATISAKGSFIGGEFGAFATAFDVSQRQLVTRLQSGPIWPIFELFQNKSNAPMTVIKEWLGPIVENALQANRRRDAKGVKTNIEECSFLEYMAANVDDVEVIREELLNILLAARDTTAALMTFTVYMFTQQPEILKRLREEIISICGDEVPTYERLRELKYLRAVLNETLRLWPPVPFDARSSRSEPCLIPTSPTSDFCNPQSTKPMYIPPDSDINYGAMLIHRRKDLWGDDADVWDPDRWLDKRLERMVGNPLIFVPFNAGPRICLGQQFALNEASFFLVRLLQKFSSFELATESMPEEAKPPPIWKTWGGRAPIEKIWHLPALTMFVKGGLWVRATKAAE